MNKPLSLKNKLNDLVKIYKEDPIHSLSLAINYGSETGVEYQVTQINEILKVEPLSTNAKITIYSEFLNLYSHRVNRHINNVLGENWRIPAQIIANQTLTIGAERLKKFKHDENKENFISYLINNFNEAESVYSLTKSFSSKDYYDESTTDYQFRKRIINTFKKDLNYHQRLMIETFANASYIDFVTYINLSEWIKGPLQQLGYMQYKNIDLIDYRRIRKIIKNTNKRGSTKLEK